MADEEQAIALELDTPAIETAEPKETPQEIVDDASTETETDDESGLTQDELDELEFGFKKYQVPKSLKADVEAWQAATTQKEQAVAERAKALDAKALQQAEASDAELDARANLRTVNSELARFKDFDFAAYQQAYQVDPMGAEQAWAYAQHLKEQKTTLEGTISKSQTERTELAQQDLAKRVQETAAWAQKEITGWKPEVTDTLVKFASEMGVPDGALKANWSPTFYKLLHRAHIGDQALKRQAAAPKTTVAPAPQIAPLQTVTAKAAPAARTSLADLAKAGKMDEYVAARRAGRTR